MAKIKRLEKIALENVRIVWPNFTGLANKYNVEGNRNFNVELTEDQAALLDEQGFNVKVKDPYTEGDEPSYTLKIKASYSFRAPRVVLITSRGRTDLPEGTVNILDWIDIKTADIIITPSVWNRRDLPHFDRNFVGPEDKSTAYLRSAYITQEEDEFDLKYADLPEAQESARVALFADEPTDFDGDDESPF